MRKCFALAWALLFMLSLAGCESSQPINQNAPATSTATESISDYLIEEDGEQYLILPISRQKVSIYNSHQQYLEKIDLTLLKTAEEKISEEIAQYVNTPGYFYLGDSDGYLYLCAEVIVDLTPPSGTENGGCGVDHEHKFFKERITK